MKKIIMFFCFFVTIYVSLQLSKNSTFSNTTENTEKSVNHIELIRSKTNDIVELDFEEYIKGVVYAEMPAGFDIETLKAQSVVARTYAYYKLSEGNSLCDNYAHCQAWKEFESTENFQKISQAVDETKGEILTYSGEAIQAFFHASSGGKTENVKNVWGTPLPYLLSVDSSGEEKIMKNFLSSAEFTYKELAEKINEYKNKAVIKPEKLKNQIKILSKTDGNRVNEIKIGSIVLGGNEVRNILNLRSSNFDIKLKSTGIVFSVKGYGHGVGMSQWGAEVMAREGKNYNEILYHYYPGTQLRTKLYNY